MPLRRFAVWILSVTMIFFGVGMVSGQNYPNKPVRIVTSSPGGGADIAARLIAHWLTGSLGQQVIVENRGGEVVAAVTVAKASPDGYTLLSYASTLWIGPLIQKMPYDPLRDFSPITLADRSPNILVVHPSLAANSVKELIALAKAKPGALNYASAITGGSSHLAAELFKSMAVVNIARIPYKGTPQALNDLISGQVQLMFPPAATVMPHVKSGRLRALAITSAESSALAPGLPTVAASGLPGYESMVLHAVFAPAKTPATLIDRLNQGIVRFLKTADAKERFLNAGLEVIGGSPEECTAKIRSETSRMSKVIKDAGIRAD